MRRPDGERRRDRRDAPPPPPARFRATATGRERPADGREPEAAGGGSRSAARGRATEVLCEPPLGRPERAGRGTAQWGRHRLAADSVEALRTVGTFGTVDAADLRGGFASARRAGRAVAELERAGLLRLERFRRGRRVIDAATLTSSGKRLLERNVDPREPGDGNAQGYRAGPARAAQVLHDAAVYKAARHACAEIEERGGSVRRVRTDEDLQRAARRVADRERQSGASREAAREAAASALDLSAQGGKLSFPDVRIEYDAPGAGPGGAFVDVEVATADYRACALQTKAAAGFRIYRMDGAGRVSPDSLPSR